MKKGTTQKGITRREFVKGAAVAGATAAIGFPYVIKAQEKTINIAGLLCFTGFAQVYGRQRDQGVKMAIEEMQPQMPDWKINYVTYDTQSNAGVAKRKAIEAVNGGADILDGAIVASEATAVGEVAEKMRKILTTGTGQSEMFGKKCNRLAFKWNAVSFTQVRTPIWTTMEEVAGAKTAKWAILTINYNWGQESRQHFLDFVQETGYNIDLVYDDFFDSKTTDFSAIFNSIRVKKPDILYLCAVGGTPTITALKQLENMGLKKHWKVVWTLGNLEAYRAMESEVVEGTLSNLIWWYTLDYPKTQEFVTRFREKYGTNPDWLAPAAYTDIKNVLTAVKSTGTKDWKTLVKFLEGYEYEGLTGREKINPNTHVVDKPHFTGIGKPRSAMKDKDDFVEIKPSPPSEIISWTKERSGCEFQVEI
jgi:branched-chain amino acid transport system substrate-binding protein